MKTRKNKIITNNSYQLTALKKFIKFSNKAMETFDKSGKTITATLRTTITCKSWKNEKKMSKSCLLRQKISMSLQTLGMHSKL